MSQFPRDLTVMHPAGADAPKVHVAVPRPNGRHFGRGTLLMTLHADTHSPFCVLRMDDGTRLYAYPSWLHASRVAARRAQIALVPKAVR